MIEINRYKLCPGTEVTAHWGEIKGDITDQSDLIDYISEHGGSAAVWGSITGDITEQSDLMNQLSSYATESWVGEQGYITSVALSGYATEDWVTAQSYLVESDLSQYATRQWVTGRGYLTSSDLSGYATESWVGEQGYITSSALSGYATESWVTAQSYLTSSSLKTVNNQSLVGEGDIEIGGLTPAQEEAIEPLENPSEGMLYTMNVKSRVEMDIPFEMSSGSDWPGYLNVINGKLYWFNIYFYEFDDNSLSFNYKGYFNGDQGGKPLWGDSQGRFYCGIDRVLNFEDMTIDTIDMNCTDYGYSWGYNRHTIWVGEYGIYNLNADAWKFDEDTQTFSTWTINTTNNLSYISQYGVWYDGHYVWYDNSTMYELKEYEDRLEVVALNDPYFPMSVDGTSLSCGYLRNVDGELYYCYERTAYQLVDGSWESISVINDYGGEFYFTYSSGKGISYLDYLIGCEGSLKNGFFSLINMTAVDVENVTWQPVKQVAVDLYNNQYIRGRKTFTDIAVTDTVYLKYIHPYEGPTTFYLNTNTTNADKINFNVSGGFCLNNRSIATVDDCIMNKTIVGYGPTVTDVISNGMSPYNYNNWTTNTGRLFSGNDYEFNGSAWVQITPVLDSSIYGTYVVQAGNSTFYVNGNTYLWDDTNSEFVEIVNSAPNYGWSIWPCGDGELRAGGDYKLVNNGGTWSWESDTVQDYKYGMTYYIDGHVYVLGLQDSSVYEYVESTKTYTKLGMYNSWTDSSFMSCGKIFFPWNNESIYMIDFDLVDPQNPYKYINVLSSIPYSNYQYFYGEYGGYTYFYRDYDHLSYCYGEQYDLPAVPSTNGTYTLQATRTGDTVTYEWVSNVI